MKDLSHSLADAEITFRHTYPENDATHRLDELRDAEYARLDQMHHVYLDYTGGRPHCR